MPIMAKSNDEYAEVKAIKTPDGTEIDYVLSKVDNTYKRTYTAIRELEDAPPLEFKSIKPNANLIDYRIYGQTVDGESVGDRTNNILPMPTTPIDTIIDDFHCEYDGMGTIKLTALTDNAVLSGFTVPLSKEFTIPLSIGQGGTGCWQMNNDVAYMNVNNSPSFTLGLWDNTDNRDYWTLNVINRVNFNYVSMGGTNINSIIIQTVSGFATNIQSGQTLTISPAFVENVTVQVPFEPYGYKVPVMVSNGTDTLTTPIYLSEPLKMVGDEAEYIDYGEQKQHRVRKNLLQNTATSQTINGVTFTVNADGSVTCNGTATATASILLQAQITLNSGSYILTGCPQGGGVNTNYKLDIIDPIASVTVAVDTGSGASLTLRQNMQARIVIYTGQVCDNLTFYPMIRKADIEDDTYEPYIENVDLDVTLPALPTLTGTNVLSVGTEVQPSDMYIKGNFKMIAGGGE